MTPMPVTANTPFRRMDSFRLPSSVHQLFWASRHTAIRMMAEAQIITSTAAGAAKPGKVSFQMNSKIT